jgi:pimeloyl-ACP methyl ester carboxylesterase
MKLNYRKQGEGPPLIILHGLFGSSDNWMTIAKSLGKYFTVVLPDQRNHGSSPHSMRHDYESMSDDIFELTQDLGINRLFLAGHSMGGKTAINFAMRWPEKLEGLLVADISPFSSSGSVRKYQKQYLSILDAINSVDLNKCDSRARVESFINEKIESGKVRGFIMKNLKRDNDNVFRWKINTVSLMKNLPLLSEGIPRPSDGTHGITGFPVVFLKGAVSEYLPDEDMPDIKKIFPAAELIKVNDAGHWIHADRPDAVTSALLGLCYGYGSEARY